MKDSLFGTRFPSFELSASAWLHRGSRALLLKLLGGLQVGTLILIEDGEEFHFRGGEAPEAFRATVRVHDPRFHAKVVFGGTVGAGEAFMEGWWDSDDLPSLVHLILRNLDFLKELESYWALLAEPAQRLWHRLRRNTKAGSRKNIAAHYDLSNEFFALWLDPTMSYSCGIFASESADLQTAQLAKIDRICRKLRLGPKDHLLEIGTGWGALAIHAAKVYGCRVTTTTISAQQHEVAARRIHEAGLTKRIRLLQRDYRDLEGRYDKLVSVEMIEAIGHEYFEAFFAACARLLKPDGQALLQTITIADRHYLAARDSVDFIKKYIFPGSCIPSVSALLSAATRAGDLTLSHLEDLTPHYATTLRHWRLRFLERRAEIARLGFSEKFLRMWEYYLALCEGGFESRHIGDVQMLFRKPLDRRPPLLPRLTDQA